MSRSYRVEVLVQGAWSGNGQRWGTQEEADKAGAGLLARWTLPDEYRVVPCDDAPNYVWRDGAAVPLVQP